MITLFILLALVIGIGIAVLAVGTGLLVVFIDPIICILVVVLFVKLVKRIKR